MQECQGACSEKIKRQFQEDFKILNNFSLELKNTILWTGWSLVSNMQKVCKIQLNFSFLAIYHEFIYSFQLCHYLPCRVSFMQSITSYPLIDYRICATNIYARWGKKYHNRELQQQFWMTAKLTNQPDVDRHLQIIRNLNEGEVVVSELLEK